MLFFLLLTSMVFPSSYGDRGCSSYCGNLQIPYPFRLRSDPSGCGNMRYELICENNSAILNHDNSSYYVLNFPSQSPYYVSTRLLDVNVAHSNCSLPSGFFDRKSSSFSVRSFSMITFFNCSEEINDARYKLVPCLSKINSSFIYAIYIDFIEVNIQIKDLKPNCKFITKIPIETGPDEHEDVFQSLHQGFIVYWFHPQLLGSIYWDLQACIPNVSIDYFLNGKVYMEDYSPFRYIPSPLQFNYSILYCLLENVTDRHYLLIVLLAVILGVISDVAILMLVLCRFVLAPLCLLVFLAYKISKLFVPVDKVETFLKNHEALSPKRYTYNEIISMTSNFKEKIGQGGFGTVFKGNLSGGYLVAVKMMGKTIGDGEDFINEVSTIGQIHHVNVVQLVGFCVEGSDIRALVYEYMANGSLDKHIFNANLPNRFLSTEKLHEIALSVAKGLNYLHQGCNMRILHFDIKPHNILLDHNFTAKISDFGLAKLHPKGYSIVFISAARGTIGYMAPELISRSFGVVSHKSDVYSFGMLLMDMAGRRRHVDMNVENSSQVYYPSWIYNKLKKWEELHQIEGVEIYENIEMSDSEKKLCKVGLWCIQTVPFDRPSMNKVVEMLEAPHINSLQMPPKPFFSASDPVASINFCINSSQSELSIISEE